MSEAVDKKAGAAMTGAAASRYFQACVSRLRRGGANKTKAEAEVRKCEDRLKGIKVKQPVLYYDLGWRTGYAAALPNKATLKITPIPAKGDAPPGAVYVPCEDVHFIEPQYLRKPWGFLAALRV
jgi:hypothetical protein